MISVLALGFLIGLQHAFEADHIAAVSSLVCGKTGIRSISRHGAIWGLGHTLALLAAGGTAIALETTLADRYITGLELAVGVMLVLLGAQVLLRLRRERIHFHEHRHADGSTHFHAHSHLGDPAPHGLSPHHHRHPKDGQLRTLSVGLMHGLAGTAALIVLTATTFAEPGLGLVYILLFGVGSIVGMTTLSAIIALPISYTARTLSWANRGIRFAVSVVTIMIGSLIIRETLAALIV